jgi:O-methyltransferase
MSLARKVVDSVRRRAGAARNEFRRWKQPKPVKSAWTRIRSESLSYTTDPQLDQLVQEVRRTAYSDALIVEAGCARGGSAILMCAAKAPDRPLKVYDIFEMIPSAFGS